jgi:hypothetical protein
VTTVFMHLQAYGMKPSVKRVKVKVYREDIQEQCVYVK